MLHDSLPIANNTFIFQYNFCNRHLSADTTLGGRCIQIHTLYYIYTRTYPHSLEHS